MLTRRNFLSSVLAGVPAFLLGQQISSSEVNKLADKAVGSDEWSGLAACDKDHCDAFCESTHCTESSPHNGSTSYCEVLHCDDCYKLPQET